MTIETESRSLSHVGAFICVSNDEIYYADYYREAERQDIEFLLTRMNYQELVKFHRSVTLNNDLSSLVNFLDYRGPLEDGEELICRFYPTTINR